MINDESHLLSQSRKGASGVPSLLSPGGWTTVFVIRHMSSIHHPEEASGRCHSPAGSLQEGMGSRLCLESWQTAGERDTWWPFSNVRPEEASCILISMWCRASLGYGKIPPPCLAWFCGWQSPLTLPYWHPCLSLPPFRCILRWLGWVCEKSLETFPNFIFSSGIHTYPEAWWFE